MLKNSLEKEKISYNCEECKEKNIELSKLSVIDKLPLILMVIVNRCGFNNQLNKKHMNPIRNITEFKIKDVFPEIENIENNEKFVLYAMIIHSGENMNSGHYFSFIKPNEDNNNNEWFEFNDRKVQKINNCKFNNVLKEKETPYIYFFKRMV